ncbi:protein alan shepard isoform X3 [Onthophagus taurus]|uniref:protein alan shepard isoform X3 n=1 Tax=Onthophagus taurus TaxID=166361 RepID=UPI000C2003C7|nr:protein alan shepard isoform X3 [Onthophagus taurus]
MAVRMEVAPATARKINYKLASGNGDLRTPCPAGVSSPMATQHHTGYRAQGWAAPPFYQARYPPQGNPPYLQNSNSANNSYSSANNTTYANNQRVATSPSNTSSSSSHTGSQSGTVSNVSTSNMPSTSSNSNSGSETLSKTNLYIRGLSANTTDKDLENMCKKFGTIISTKAILDKNTNKCKGYGFVDFEHPTSAEGAVKALTAANVQAQMAKVGNSPHYRLPTQQQEQDPTNLYIANLPLNYKESDVDKLLCQHGQVISTRILRDSTGTSKGVGFARMETREKCEQIIQMYNGMKISGSKEGLLVKFADGGNKKKNVYKNNENNKWRDGTDSCIPAVSYDPSALAQNGVPAAHMVPTITGFRPYSQVQNYPIPAGTQWVPPYIMSAAPIASMDDSYNIPSHMGPYKNDGQAPRGISVMMPSSEYMPQLTAQMGAVQLGSGSYISQPYHPAYYQPQFISMPVADSEHTSNAASPEDPYPAAAYQQQPQK